MTCTGVVIAADALRRPRAPAVRWPRGWRRGLRRRARRGPPPGRPAAHPHGLAPVLTGFARAPRPGGEPAARHPWPAGI